MQSFLLKSFVSQKQKYRLTVGIVLTFEDKIFCGLDPRHGNWSMPQGGVETGEGTNEAAARELFEETGIQAVKWLDSSDWYILDLPDFVRNNERYKSISAQKYKWFLASVEVKPQVKLNHEYVNYEWLEPEELLKRSEGYFKGGMYRQILKEFGIAY
jgi:putative (di)nucleoside polyphosphate hydrolase